MTRLYLVRHGRATAGWDDAADPGLDALGHRQAGEVARTLARLGPMAVISSPLLRCQQTAAPLCALWSTTASLEPGVAEIPSPPGVAMDQRVQWLRGAMSGTWADLGEVYTSFRDRVVATLCAPRAATVVFSHFVAINAAIGVATGDDRLVINSLDNCSITVVEAVDGGLALVRAGHEADTLIR